MNNYTCYNDSIVFSLLRVIKKIPDPNAKIEQIFIRFIKNKTVYESQQTYKY